MKRIQIVYLLIIVTTIGTPALVADQPASRDAGTGFDFTIGGVGIDSTLDELRERLPSAVEGHAPMAIPMRDDHLVVINNGAKQVPTAYFRFIDQVVISIEIHYTAMGVNEICANKPMIDQLIARFGNYDKTWRNDNLDGGVDIYVWKSDTRFMSFAKHDNGSAKVYLSGTNHPQLYPPKTPKTSLLGIDPVPNAENGR